MLAVPVRTQAGVQATIYMQRAQMLNAGRTMYLDLMPDTRMLPHPCKMQDSKMQLYKLWNTRKMPQLC